MMILLFALLLQAPAATECHPITDDRILGRHLSAAVPELAGIPAEQVVGYSPVPGVKRVFPATQLQRLARAHGLNDIPAKSTCFEWRMSVPQEKELLAAMTKSLTGPSARIEILEISRHPAPAGELVFPVSGLQPVGPSDLKGRVWRGYVNYSGRRRFPLWARVRITTTEPRVVAAEKLAVGTPIRAEQVRLVTDETPMLEPLAAHSMEEVAGKIPRRSIEPGAVILRNQIQEPAEIRKGQMVRVEAGQGAVHFTLEARAESNGRRGEMVVVRNPTSGKNFRARVEGPGKASVGGSVQ